MDDIYLSTHFQKLVQICDIVTKGCGLCTFPDAVSPVVLNVGGGDCGPSPTHPRGHLAVSGDIFGFHKLGSMLVHRGQGCC